MIKEDQIIQGTNNSYKILEVVGIGNISKVFKAVNLQTCEYVAIKVISKIRLGDQNDNLYYEREILILKKLMKNENQHQNIIKIFEIFESNNCQFVVFELLTDGNLIEYLLSKDMNIDEIQALNIMYQVTKAICHLHKLKIMHRDIKPENILLKVDSQHITVKLIDFGVSSQNENSIADSMVGSISYISKEVLLHQKMYNEKCDVWSLGCLFHELITGNQLFCGETIKQIYDQIMSFRQYDQNSKWSYIISKCLEVDIEKRISSKELLDLLQSEYNKYNIQKQSMTQSNQLQEVTPQSCYSSSISTRKDLKIQNRQSLIILLEEKNQNVNSHKTNDYNGCYEMQPNQETLQFFNYEPRKDISMQNQNTIVAIEFPIISQEQKINEEKEGEEEVKVEEEKQEQENIHVNCQVIAFQTQIVQKNQLKCIQCIIDENISGSSLLSIQEICQSSQLSIFGNWPPLKNKSVLLEINQILLNDKNDKQNVFLKIRQYFDDFKEKLEVKMQQIENQITQRAQQYLVNCSQITSQYNNSAEKEYLQQLFINSNSFQYDEINQQVQSIVKSKIQEQEKNQENLKKVVDSFISSSKIIYFSLPQSFKDDILQELSKLEVFSYQAQPQSREQDSIINKDPKSSKIDVINDNLNAFYNLKQEQLNDLIQLTNKIIEIDNQSIQEYNQENNNWGNLRQNSYKIYTALKNSHFCSESKSAIKRILQQYPVFDLISPISIDLHNRNQYVKLTNQYQLIMSNNKEYQSGKININNDGKYFLEKSSLNGYSICYSNILFNPKDKYIVRVQIDKNSDQDWIVVGLMSDSLKDKSTLYEQQICFHYGYGDLANQTVLKGQNLQLDQLKKGKSMILELRICIQDKLFMITDYPKHENVAQINKEPKSPFLNEENYRFSIALYNPGDKVTLIEVEVVQQFNQI